MQNLNNREAVELPVEFKFKNHEAVMSILWTASVLKKNSKHIFSNHLASDAQFNILSLLRDSEDQLSQNDLSRLLLVDKSNITGLIDRLEKMKLIERMKVDGDRRKYHIALTPKGKSVVDELDEMYMEKIHTVTKDFEDGEFEKLIDLTRKLRVGLTKIGD
jgi:DNA-binding MarR family transcriptional regulator